MKTKSTHKLLAMLLATVMVLSLLPMTVLADGDNPEPAISIVATSVPSKGYASEGTTIMVLYTVTNTGNVPVSCSQHSVLDGSGVDLSTSHYSAVDGGAVASSNVNPEESFTTTITYTVREADVAAGKLVRTYARSASVVAPFGEGSCSSSPVRVEIPLVEPAPAITLEYVSGPNQANAVEGTEVTIVYKVTNTGNVPFTCNMQSVRDGNGDKVSAYSLAFEGAVNGSNVLPEEEFTSTITYKVLPEDIAVGKLVRSYTQSANVISLYGKGSCSSLPGTVEIPLVEPTGDDEGTGFTLTGGGTFTRGDTTGLTFATNIPRSKFARVEINDIILFAGYYEITNDDMGNAVITLMPDYLEEKPEGNYGISIVTDVDGFAAGTFTIQEADSTDTTEISYTVEHYQQTADGYQLVDTENLTGSAGQTVTASAKTYPGFYLDTDNENAVPSGVLVDTAISLLTLKLYYNSEEPAEEPGVSVTVYKEVTNTPANGDFYVEGETIEYRITVTNDGAVTIYEYYLYDSLEEPIDPYWIAGGMHISCIGECQEDETNTRVFTYSYTVTAEDVAAGSVSNYAWLNYKVYEDGDAESLTETSNTVTSDTGTEPPVVPGDDDTSYTITATAGTGGSITPSGSVAVAQGESKAFAMTPAEGFVIDDVVVDGESKGAITGYTFSDVRADHTISVTFKAAPTQPAEDNPDTGTPGQNDKPLNPNGPKTGDESRPVLWAGLVIMALLGLAVTLVAAKRSNLLRSR